MKIVVDAMGGDHAPPAVVEGAITVLEENDAQLQIILAGDRARIQRELDKARFSSTSLTVYHTSQVVTMTDKPSMVFKTKPDSSLVKGIELVKEKKADAFVSAGNTGALLSTALFLLGTIEGVRRPGAAVYIPVHPSGLVLCDAGANSEVKPRHLFQFAIMASEYIKHIHGVERPRIGLLNIGVEATKGLDLYVETHRLMSHHLPSFYGNIESRYLLGNLVDVVICDGFVGNHIIKFAEGWISHVAAQIERKIRKQITDEDEATDIKRLFAEVIREYDYEEYGGAPLLGVNGICVICHGSSTSKSIKNAILAAKKSVEENLVGFIREGISSSLSCIDTSRQ